MYEVQHQCHCDEYNFPQLLHHSIHYLQYAKPYNLLPLLLYNDIPRLRVAPVKDLNALELLEHDRLVLTREVIESLGDTLAAAPGTRKARAGRSGRGAKARAEGTPR